MASPPTTMISYSWCDAPAAELLHDEFALRGFQLIHDRYTFTEGSRVPTSMADAVETCDAFVAYLTPHSLYLDRPAHQPRPALAGELMPALRRRRRNLNPGALDTPIVIALAHGLGGRHEAAETIRLHTGENVGSLWTTWLDQSTPGITQPEAALVADRAFDALHCGESTRTVTELHIATRGTTPPARYLTLDATRLLGGNRQAGQPSDWQRLLAALQSVLATLDSLNRNPGIRVDLGCHISAALATGRLLHQATRWLPTFATRHGDINPATSDADHRLRGDFDQHKESGDIVVDIDLLGHDVAAKTDELASRLPQLGGRISLTRSDHTDLTPEEIASLARWAATVIRSAQATVHPSTIHFAQAVPAAFAALLGHHLTALSGNLTSYELNDGSYTPVLTIPPTTP